MHAHNRVRNANRLKIERARWPAVAGTGSAIANCRERLCTHAHACVCAAVLSFASADRTASPGPLIDTPRAPRKLELESLSQHPLLLARRVAHVLGLDVVVREQQRAQLAPAADGEGVAVQGLRR